jgi:glycopeptide antibiotics resistance protein
MYIRILLRAVLALYSALLVKVMVFKDIPMIRIGHLMLNFGGTNAEGEPNFVPFKTILSYGMGNKGLLIAGINLVGNVGLLVPVGFLIPLVYRNVTWRKSLALAVMAGLAIEGMQVLFQVGIFDIDDVILNALGVVIGYGLYKLLTLTLQRTRVVG